MNNKSKTLSSHCGLPLGSWDEHMKEEKVKEKYMNKLTKIVIQVNGVYIDSIYLDPNSNDLQIVSAARQSNQLSIALGNKSIDKVVIVPGKLVNFIHLTKKFKQFKVTLPPAPCDRATEDIPNVEEGKKWIE